MTGPRSLERATPPYHADALRSAGVAGLNFGCGDVFVPGWINADLNPQRDARGARSQRGRLVVLEQADAELLYLEQDALERFPFEDGAFEWVFCEHFIEHIPAAEAIRWLREMRRLLRPGGILRVSTPDLARYVRGYLDPGDDFFAEHRRRLERRHRETGGPDRLPDRPAWMVNQIFRLWGHQWVYDLAELTHAGLRAGFRSEAIECRSFRDGAEPALAALDQEWRSDETVYVEMRA